MRDELDQRLDEESASWETCRQVHEVHPVPSLAELNALPQSDARAEFLKCCGSCRWADAMVARRPFTDRASLAAAADETRWSAASRDDCLEAFAAHPK